MPQLDPSTFLPQIIWLAISFVVLYILMARVALPRIGNVLAERQDKIDDNLTMAEELRATAQADQEAYDKSLASAREEARAAIQKATQEAGAEAQAKQDELAHRMAAQIKTAEAEIEQAKTNARASIRDAAVGVAQAATHRLIGTTPSDQVTGAAVERALEGRG